MRPKFVVGDSLTVGVDLAGFNSIAARRCLNVVKFDAEVGRTTAEAVDVVASWGALPENAVVLVGLGTNDTWSSRRHFIEDAERLLDVIGDRDVVWVDVSDGLGAHEEQPQSIGWERPQSIVWERPQRVRWERNITVHCMEKQPQCIVWGQPQ